ncbi:hypothetical protein DXG01_015929, partial [Tephrocybe rancida]
MSSNQRDPTLNNLTRGHIAIRETGTRHSAAQDLYYTNQQLQRERAQLAQEEQSERERHAQHTAMLELHAQEAQRRNEEAAVAAHYEQQQHADFLEQRRLANMDLDPDRIRQNNIE